MITRKYETLFIVKPELPEETMLAMKDRLEGVIDRNGGIRIAFQDWGKRRLAYPIRKFPKADYIYARYLGDGKTVGELERNLKVLDYVIRYMTVKLEDRVESEGYDIEAEVATIFPFAMKPRDERDDRRDRDDDDDRPRGRDRDDDRPRGRDRDDDDDGPRRERPREYSDRRPQREAAKPQGEAPKAAKPVEKPAEEPKEESAEKSAE